jgi:hypothetical protein
VHFLVAGSQEAVSLGSMVASGWNHTIFTTQDTGKVFEMRFHDAGPSEDSLPSAQETVHFGENITIFALAAGEQHRQAFYFTASPETCVRRWML